MLSSSTRQATAFISIVVTVLVLAAGCLVFLSLRDSASPALLDPSLRRLGAPHNDKSWADPRTTQLVVREGGVRPPDAAVEPLWKDIGYDLDWSCGKNKCFFHSVSDPKKGYLISETYGHGHHITHALTPLKLKYFDYAQELESEFGIRHFVTGIAYQTLAPEYFVEHLHDDVRERLSSQTKKAGKGLIKEGTKLVIEECVAAPKGSILLKCTRDFHWEKMALDSIIKRGEGGWAQELVQGMSVTKDLLDRHPDLAIDFQIMFDLGGQVYQLDLDRGETNQGVRNIWRGARDLSGTKACLDKAIAYISVKSINES